MNKSKLYCFAIAGMLSFVGIQPITTLAKGTDTVIITQSDKTNNQQDKKAALKQKMEQANEKWNSLSADEKEEIYSLIESKLEAEDKVIDKLVELGVIQNEDAANFKTHLQNRFNKLKESGEFPLLRQKGK
ncbi:MAG: hypothetical protein K0R92_1367 [Lachnospiraceae bacterium]|jgi:ribosomal protein S20|nr:hypothetical protein [Lachnospiraceae bacterium]